MNKQELANQVADATGLGRSDAVRIIDSMLEIITETLSKGEEVRLVGFGNFVAGVRKASTGRNPRTGDPMNLAESVAPKFRVGRNLKMACNPANGASTE